MNQRYKILIVDDQPENIQTLMKAFEMMHPEYILYQSTSGQAALDLALNIKIDLIITDWEMPGMSGIELINILKAEPRTMHIPVIMVTGVMMSSADLDIALSAGAYDYLRKPVDKVELAARTSSAIQCVKMHLRELATKNVELTEKTMLLTRNNQFNIGISKRIRQLETLVEDQTEISSVLRKISEDIDQNAKEATWRHFEIAFQNVHPDFTQSISHQFPQITPSELKQCILIRLGMNTKDMASVLFQSTESLKVSRSRIRKKIGISNDTNLQSFLMRY